MKLKNLLIGSAILSSTLFAGADMTPVETVVEGVPVETKTDTWSFELEPYMLASSISGTSSMGRLTGAEVDVDFADILEVLDIGAMVHFEAHHQSGWGLWLDYGFMNLSEDISGPLGGVVDMSLHQGVLEAFGLYRQELANGTIDYLAGIRWWDNDIDVTVNPASLSGSATADIKEDWVDLVVGARWTQPINESWKLRLRGDIGGFGLSSDFTATASVGVLYTINDLMDLDLTYKATWVDYENGTRGTQGYFEYDTVTYGPVVGLNFKF